MTTDPMDDEMERAPWCLQVPTGDPTDPDLIGPFSSSREADAFAEAHPDRCKRARLRCMATPRLEQLYAQVNAAEQRKRVALISKLGLSRELLKQPIAPSPQDVVICISASVAADVAGYLEHNCSLPGVAQICDLLRGIAEIDAIVVQRQDDDGADDA